MTPDPARRGRRMLDRRSARRLLDGCAPYGAGEDDLVALFAQIAAAPSPFELDGEIEALAAFRAARAPTGAGLPVDRRTWSSALAAIGSVLAVTGSAAVGVLTYEVSVEAPTSSDVSRPGWGPPPAPRPATTAGGATPPADTSAAQTPDPAAGADPQGTAPVGASPGRPVARPVTPARRAASGGWPSASRGPAAAAALQTWVVGVSPAPSPRRVERPERPERVEDVESVPSAAVASSRPAESTSPCSTPAPSTVAAPDPLPTPPAEPVTPSQTQTPAATATPDDAQPPTVPTGASAPDQDQPQTSSSQPARPGPEPDDDDGQHVHVGHRAHQPGVDALDRVVALDPPPVTDPVGQPLDREGAVAGQPDDAQPPGPSPTSAAAE